MNFQEKLFESSAELRERAQTFANQAIETARTRADAAAKRVEKLKGSMTVLNTAGRELNKVARRHAIVFVKQNSTLATKVRDDVAALARSTFATLTKSAAVTRARKPTAARTRARKAAPKNKQ
jgi:hypothetical protein